MGGTRAMKQGGRTFWMQIAERLGMHRVIKALSFYPPFVGAGIRVRAAAEDLSWIEVEMGLHKWNQNYVGTQFGGSMYSMCDPFLMVMVLTQLGNDYIVWDKAAAIDFVRPGRRTVRARFEISPERLAEIRDEVERNRKALPKFIVEIRDDTGELVATVEKTLYVRRKREEAQPKPSAATAASGH